MKMKKSEIRIQKNNSILKKNNSHRSQQIISHETTDIERYDTNKIFQEFKRHLIKADKKQHQQTLLIDNAYKDLLCSVKKQKQNKINKLQKVSSQIEIIKKTTPTFLRSRIPSKDLLKFPQTKLNTFILPNDQQNQLSESKTKYNPDLSSCKFKPIRPMTTQNKFQRNKAAKQKTLFENKSHSRLLSQVSRFLSPNTKSFSNLFQGKSRTTTVQTKTQKPIPQISESIMMVQLQQTKLKQEISLLSQSMNKLTKQLAEIKKELQVQDRNEKKYKHICNLATSIKNETDYIKIQNQKGFSQMISKQDETLSSLKKFKMNLRKQKDEMENDYIEGINEFVKFQQEKSANKNKQLLFMLNNNITIKKGERVKINNDQTAQILAQSKVNKQKGMKFELISRYNSVNKNKISGQQTPNTQTSNTKLIKKLVDQLDSLIQLFQQKQPTFQTIKEQQCTRVRLCKVKKQLLPKQRVQILQKIQEFQSKYDIKIVSVSNLMQRIYRSLNDQNQKLESDCLKLTQSKEQSTQELKKIIQKYGTEIDEQMTNEKSSNQQLVYQKKLNSHIHKNSMICLKAIEGFYNILFKYRYMFSLALTLDVDKKQFRDTVIQIDGLFSEGLMTGFGTDKFVSASNEKYDIINQFWFLQILKDLGLHNILAQQLTQIMFNDQRVGLMIKKSWIENYLAKIKMTSQQKELQILKIIDILHKDCSQIYQLKMPTISSLFLSCFKSLHMTKYQHKLAASSNQRGEIFLPNRPVRRLYDPEFTESVNESINKESQDSDIRKSSKKITLVSEQSTNRQDQIQKNPNKIIFNLESIKNQSHKKFKALNFSSSGKIYKYNQSIIIPNFHLIDKCEDF